MTAPVWVISVVRDWEMYKRCVADNPFLQGCARVPYDNSRENLSVSVRYNRFLQEGAAEGWIVFCHEDWEVLEPLAEAVSRLDPEKIYGVIGVSLEEGRWRDLLVIKGAVQQCGKDGGDPKEIRGRDASGRVDTVDCQCLIVHSSLVARLGLRFDERFAFDMYAEDFCVAAFEQADVVTEVFPLACRHHSGGHTSRGFRPALRLVRAKYRTAKKRYASIVGHHSTFGGRGCKPVRKWRR